MTTARDDLPEAGMTSTTSAERQRAFKARRNASGIVRVSVWVPKQYAERVRRYAARLMPKEPR